MTKPILYIFAGANGSGKTTVAKNFTTLLEIPFINADEILFQMPASPDSTPFSAGKEFIKEVDAHIKKGSSFAIESTLSGKTIAAVIREAKQEGFQIHISYLFLFDPENNIDRIKIRVKSGGHFVPDADVRRRFYRSIRNFWLIYRALSDTWTLMYNSSERMIVVSRGNKTTTDCYENDLMMLFLENINENI